MLNLDYRLQRVGFSVIGGALVGWRTALLPIGLLLANSISIAVLAKSAARLAQMDRRYWWLLASPAALIGFASDTAEPMAIALLVSTIEASSIRAGILGAVLGTVRPDFGLGLGVARSPGSAAAGWFVAATSLIGVVLVSGVAGTWGASNITAPLMGYVSTWEAQDLAGRFVYAVAMVAGFALLGLSFVRRGFLRASLLLCGLAILSFAPPVLDNVINLVRVSGAVPVVGVCAVISRERSPSDQ
jgi:hypothetical protein